MKKSNKALLMLSSFVLAFSALSMNVMAEEIAPQETEASIEFTAGNLSLESVPSFSFGTNTISSATTSYSPAADGNNGNLSVSDLRGTGDGWHVTASLSSFKNQSENSLQGAELALETPVISAANGTIASAPTSAQTLTLSSDGTSFAIQNAAKDQGQGVWNTTWSKPSLKVIAGTAQTGKNSATIEWVLHEAP